MKGLLFNILLFVICYSVNSQQVPQYTHFVHNYFGLNPALAGSSKCLNIKAGYRSQWVGFEGAPKSTFVSVSSKLKLKKINTSRQEHGIGAYIENDEIGPMSRSTIYLAYAYHFPIARNVTASVGIFGGLMQMGIDATKINLLDPADPLINGSGKVFFIPDFSPGIFFNHDDWFFGYSIRQVFLNKWQKVIGSNKARNRFHHYIVGGKRFKTDAFNIVPSGLIKFVAFSKPALDLNVMIEISNRYEFGVSWRNTDAIAALFNVKFLKHFSLGYAFDMTTSKIKSVSSNTHEVLLGIRSCPFENKNTFICPTF